MKIPKEISDALQALTQAKFEAYLVGGCVRDLLMNQKPKDWDITTNAKPEEIEKIFAKAGYKTFYENKFGTVSVVTPACRQGRESEDETLKNIEVTPFRKEAKYSDKRHPDKVSFSASLEDDLKRRDFTINALALLVKSEARSTKSETNSKFKIQNSKFTLVDLFNGQEDLKNKIIRAVGEPKERFDEDALRIMRAIRLSAELGFSIEEKTQKALQEKAGLLQMIAKERIRDEFVKILMADKPDKAIEEMRKLGILKYVIPELEEGCGVGQNKHHIYKVWEHNLRALMHAVEKKWPLEIRLTSLLHDIGKPRAKVGQGPDSTFYGHEVIGAKMTAQILTRLKFPKKFAEKVIKLVRWHLFFSDTEKITLSAVRRMIRNVGPENIWDLMKVRFTDRVGMGRPKERPFRLRKYEAMVEQALRDPISVKMLKINGEDIMKICQIKPGPKIGFLLSILLEEVLDEPKFNTKEYLEKRISALCQMSDKDLEELGKKARAKATLEEEKKIDEIHKKYWVK